MASSSSSLPAQATRAIVARAPLSTGKQRNWNLEDVHLPATAELDDHEVLVEMVASGICHTDLGCGSYAEGAAPFPLPRYPRILGHEGAGYVKAVGSKAKSNTENKNDLKVGDPVLLSFAFCGKCHNCQFGAPGYCGQFVNMNFQGSSHTFTDAKRGEPIGGGFFGQSSFARLVKAHVSSVVNVAGLIRNDAELKMLAPLGCGIQTGAGTITELGSASESDIVTVIGLGGVGLSAIMTARLKSCKTIIAIDRVTSRLELARKLGATAIVTTSTSVGTTGSEAMDNSKLVEAVRMLTGGIGSNITVEATGVPALIRAGLEFTANQGRMILVGVAPADAQLIVPIVPYMTSGKILMGSMEGGVTPSKYIPQMIEWYQSGQFPIDQLVKHFPVEQFEEAIQEMEQGSVVKPVLIW